MPIPISWPPGAAENAGHRAEHRRAGPRFACCGGAGVGREESNSTRRIFLITGDGELAEGSNWEAALAAAHYGLDNLVIINDKNNLQLAGPTREIMNTDPLADKWRAFGMEVSECQGNDMASVVAAIEGLQQDGKPNVIANTTKARGSPYPGAPEWHHRCRKAKRSLWRWRN